MLRIHLVGDSTVTEQPRCTPYNPALCFCGWGQMLHRFLKTTIQVCNYAVSGYTTVRFRTEGKYDALKACLQAGDYVFFQFGHNDQKRLELAAEKGFTFELERYVEEVREMQGIPVLVTPPARNSWRGDNGEYLDLLAPYADAIRALAVRLNVPLLDLHAKSTDWIRTLGLQGAKRYFHAGDYTHPNDFGGWQWARMLADEIAASKHIVLERLRGELLPNEKWEDFDAQATQADPVYGWLAVPLPRISYDEWQGQAHVSKADALIMAMKGYGYFSVTAYQEQPPIDALACAQENHYLPGSFHSDGMDLNQPISADMFRQLFITACRGRNELPAQALALRPCGNPDGSISYDAASQYASELERLATGCSAAVAARDYTPEGA